MYKEAAVPEAPKNWLSYSYCEASGACVAVGADDDGTEKLFISEDGSTWVALNPNGEPFEWPQLEMVFDADTAPEKVQEISEREIEDMVRQCNGGRCETC